MMLVIYRSSLIRSVIALHNLINNKEEYERRMAEWQSQNGEGSSSQDSANSIYLDVVGGPNKKRRIYGLGSQVTNVVGSSSTPSTSSVDGVSPTEIVAMQAKIQDLTDELCQKNL